MAAATLSKIIENRQMKKALLCRAYKETSYYKTPIFTKMAENIPTVVGPMALFDACALSTIPHSGDLGPTIFNGLLVGFSLLFRQISLKNHKNVVAGAAKLGSELKEKGFSAAERKIVVNEHLSNGGNLFFTNLFKVIYPKRVQNLADGIITKSGFVG